MKNNSLRESYFYCIFVLHECLKKVFLNNYPTELVSLIMQPLIIFKQYSFDKNINMIDLILNPIKNDESIVSYKNEELLLKTNKFELGNCVASKNSITFGCDTIGYRNECVHINKFSLDLDDLISSRRAKKQLFGENCDPDLYYPWIQTTGPGKLINSKCTMQICLPVTKLIYVFTNGIETSSDVTSAMDLAETISYKTVIITFRLKILSSEIFGATLAYWSIPEIVEIKIFR